MGAKETFVTIRQSADGIGKLKDIRNGQAEVEFFDSPAGPRLIHRQISVRLVEGVELSAQTRVFAFDPTTDTWRAGRVGHLVSADAMRRDEDHYLVHFPNGLVEHIPISRLFVRWNRPIEDPTEYLAAKITDTPFFFEGRSRIVRHIATQRAAFGGMTALASSSIELLEHQISIVRKVLADPIQRYLMADEVGLGKTIEAGILIKQHLLDHPLDASILVVVPDHLVTQWRRELSTKFGISHLDSRLKVTAISNWCTNHQGVERSLIVIDEAHLLASWAFSDNADERQSFAVGQRQASASPRLLLLSGTPVLHQEQEFLAMLHLLDPHGYPLEDVEGFRLRVAERQTVAEATVDLTDSASSSFIEDAIGRLKPLFPGDQRLKELSLRVESLLWNDESDPHRIAALRALRIHIRETYKLHRRLLRTRRVDSRIADHLLPRSGVETISYEDLARKESASFLDLWRQSLPESALARSSVKALLALLVSGAFEHPRVLARLLDQRLALLGSGLPSNEHAAQPALLGQPSIFEDEMELLRERKELISSVSVEDERQSALSRWITVRSEIRRFVIFASDSEVADLLALRLRASLPDLSTWRFSGKSTEIADFHSTLGRSILVCDRNAEEGLNLQRSGATIVHYDLPTDALRIEQRVGRLDRIEAIGRLRNVVFSGDLPYENEWLDCLLSGIGVFSRSVSALQYLLATSRGRIENDLVSEGRSAFTLELERLLNPIDGVEAETRKIVAQEALDSVEIDSESERAFYLRLTEVDEVIESEGQISLDAWIVKRLNFKYQELSPGVGRYVYITDQTLVPLFDAYRTFQECLDIESKLQRRRHELPLVPSTFRRSTAEQKRVALLRVGNPMLNALEQFVRQDDRGAAFAYWRYLPEFGESPSYFFRFDFFIEATPPRADDAANTTDGNLNAAAFQRCADEAFPVQYRTVWLDSDLQLVSNPTRISELRLLYSRHPRADGSFDRNLNSARWPLAEQKINLSDWQGRCERARQEAERKLRSSSKFFESCLASASQLESSLAERTEIFESRLGKLSGSLRAAELQAFQVEEEFDLAVLAAVQAPTVRVDSVGIVVLSPAPLDEAKSSGGDNATF